MRIAYVCTDPGVPVFGRKGASVHVQAVVRALVRRGDQVDLITPRTGGAPPADLAEVPVHVLDRERPHGPAEREIAAQRADAQAADVLDRLHRESPLDLVYERYSLWGAAAGAWARGSSVPHLVEVNAPLVQEQEQHRTLVDRDGAHRVAARVMSGATAVLCVSDAVADWARARAQDPTRVHTVTNGVDTARIVPSVQSAVDDDFTIGFVGTLKPWHGVETMLEALALLVDEDPAYRALVVGDGPQAEALSRRAEQLALGDRLEMTGALDPDQVPAQLHRMQIGIAPYPAMTDFYFSPLKVYEYLAAGLPVVASAVGDLPDTLGEGRLGVLVEPDDPRALAAAIAALRLDPARRNRLGLAGREEAVRLHDWSAVVDRSLRLLAGVRT